MSCEPFREALIDEALPRPSGYQEHLDGCADCRRLLALHQELSSGARRAPEAKGAPISSAEVLSLVGRRRATRVASGAGAALLAAVLIAFAFAPDPEETAPAMVAAVQQAPTASPPEPVAAEDTAPPTLTALLGDAESYGSAELARADEAYGEYAALLEWAAPDELTEDSPLEAEFHSLTTSTQQKETVQ